MKFKRSVRVTAEFLGTAVLVAAVIASGIMAERLANGNAAIALLANTIATGAALVALILTFGPISGAHLNPAVSLADAMERGLTWSDMLHYASAQIAGGICGAMLAHAMFELPLGSPSHPYSRRESPIIERVRSDLRTSLRDLGMFPDSIQYGSFCRRQLYHRSRLVHRIYILCESRCYNRQTVKRHLRRHTSRRCSALYRRPTRRWNRRDALISLASSSIPLNRKRCPDPALNRSLCSRSSASP
jgi:major intrinsic protein